MSDNLILVALIIFLMILMWNEYKEKEGLAPMLAAALEGDEQSYRSNVHKGFYQPLVI
jgi:hypothetical protein